MPASLHRHPHALRVTDGVTQVPHIPASLSLILAPFTPSYPPLHFPLPCNFHPHNYAFFIPWLGLFFPYLIMVSPPCVSQGPALTSLLFPPQILALPPPNLSLLPMLYFSLLFSHTFHFSFPTKTTISFQALLELVCNHNAARG